MIKMSVENAKAISVVNNRVTIRKNMFIADIVLTARLLQSAIKQGIDTLIPDGGDHFNVRLWGNQYEYQVILETVDDIGKYIYYGTEGHWIGQEGSVLASSEFGPISGPVWHPAIPPRKEEIDNEVQLALQKVLVFMR